ncbi:MAG TPA: DUF4337 family protein [Polyangiaceae bacterium]|nr:DUF4337 family protein [Polyangiaceae bacterium]
MPEDGIETQELKERLEETQEHAGHGRQSSPWLTWLSLSTAIIAVLAAVAALESGSYANEAIVQKNDAVLHQSKADDAWAYYQAKGIEATVYATQAEASTRPEAVARWSAEAERRRGERADARRQAQEEEALVARMDQQSEHSLHVHHQFAKSVTIFQVAIALSAIAALTRRKPMWWVSLAAGVVAAAFFAVGLLGR